MSDQNLKDFYTRISRIENMHAKGYGFEAVGTLGRSVRPRPRQRWFPAFRSALFIMMAAFCLKAALHYRVGPELYDDRVSRLAEGQGFDRVGAVLMQADPITLWLADWLRETVPPRD
jgi:hypothetical protein